MQLTYPAIITEMPEKYHARIPDLAGCEAEASTLIDVMEELKDAFRSWIEVELEDDIMEFPPVTPIDSFELKENEFVRSVSITIKFTYGWDE